MKKQIKLFLSMVLILLSSIEMQAQHQWMFKGSSSGSLISGSSYDLINWQNNQSIYCKERKIGINLGYRDPGVLPYAITISKNGQGEITQCDNVAIYVVGGGYLRYKYRKKGISLVFSSTPVYEWTISAKNKSCNTVTTDIKYGLYNVAVNRHLIYYNRNEHSIYLDWYYE